VTPIVYPITFDCEPGSPGAISQCKSREVGTLHQARLDEIRGFFAKQMASASGSLDPRLERMFELVPREAFLPRGPWKIKVAESYIDTPSADPVYVYQNVLVALDAGKGINNGEPMLHARWIGAVAPRAGETVTHIGAGMGYYSAILSMLVRPGGRLTGFEIEQDLAVAARRNLAPFENASIVIGDATLLDTPPSDLIYVNAGVIGPPEQWLAALRPGGRMIFSMAPVRSRGARGTCHPPRIGVRIEATHAGVVHSVRRRIDSRE